MNISYRKIYEDYFRIKIPAGYDIHHIDRNRGNNDIKNLILLPKELHQRLHNIQTGYICDKSMQFLWLGSNLLCGAIHDEFLAYAEIYRDLFPWVSAREIEILNVQSGFRGVSGVPNNYNQFR